MILVVARGLVLPVLLVLLAACGGVDGEAITANKAELSTVFEPFSECSSHHAVAANTRL